MSRITDTGSQCLEIGPYGDLVHIDTTSDALSAFLALFYYGKGIFPWMKKNGHTLWWSPHPRAVLFCDEVHISKSLKKVINKNIFRITADAAFNAVVLNCRDQDRGSQIPSWITEDWIQVMNVLHQLGHAHSIEVWKENTLVGGLFGVAVGQMFYGCSMFHTYPNASKVALVCLARNLERWGFPLIDCAISNPYLKQMGARFISRNQFHGIVATLVRGNRFVGSWKNQLSSKNLV